MCERKKERASEVKRSSCVLKQVSAKEIMVKPWDKNDAFASLRADNGGLEGGGGKFIALLSKRSDISPSAVKFQITYLLQSSCTFCGVIQSSPFLSMCPSQYVHLLQLLYILICDSCIVIQYMADGHLYFGKTTNS